MDLLVDSQVCDNNVLFQPNSNLKSTNDLTPEITAILDEQCSSFAISSAASISKVPYP